MIKTVGFATITALFLLSGCGGDSDNKSSIKVEEIAQLEGFWDISYDKDGKHDELYEYYLPNGNIILYDYQADSFDNGEDCYLIGESIFEIRQNVAGTFYYFDTEKEEIGLQFDATLGEDKLTLTSPFNPEEVLVYKKITKSRIDMEAKQCSKEVTTNKLQKKRP